MHLCERKKSFIKIPTLILYLKLYTSVFGRFDILTRRVMGGWACNLASFWRKLLEGSICEWPLTKIIISFPNHGLNMITIVLLFRCNFFKYCQLLFAQVSFNKIWRKYACKKIFFTGNKMAWKGVQSTWNASATKQMH